MSSGTEHLPCSSGHERPPCPTSVPAACHANSRIASQPEACHAGERNWHRRPNRVAPGPVGKARHPTSAQHPGAAAIFRPTTALATSLHLHLGDELTNNVGKPGHDPRPHREKRDIMGITDTELTLPHLRSRIMPATRARRSSPPPPKKGAPTRDERLVPSASPRLDVSWHT